MIHLARAGFATILATISKIWLGSKVDPDSEDLSFAPKVFDWTLDKGLIALIESYDYPEMVEVRRKHFHRLGEAFKSSKRFQPFLTSLDSGVCPWMFPLRCERPEEVAERLSQKGVGVLHFWSEGVNPHEKMEFPFVHELRRHMLALPLHQDLTSQQIDYLIECLQEA